MNNFVVIGLGRFGAAIAQDLYEMGYEVLALDKNKELVDEISDCVTNAIAVDVTDEAALKSLGVRNFSVAIIAIGGDMETSILTTVILRDLGVPYIIAKAQSDIHAKVLKKIGADKVIFPEKDMAIRVAHNIVAGNVLDYIALSPNYRIVGINVPERWIGSSLVQLNLRAKHGINVIAVNHGEDDITVSPDASYVFKEGDVAVILGKDVNVDELNKI